MNFLDILHEGKRTPWAAIHIGQNGKPDRVVYFASQESMQRAIARGTHRGIDKTRDADLLQKEKEKEDKAARRAQKNPGADTGTKSSDPAPMRSPANKTASPEKKGTSTEKPVAKKKPTIKYDNLDVDIDTKLDDTQKLVLNKKTKSIRRFWDKKIGQQLANIPITKKTAENQIEVSKLLTSIATSSKWSEKVAAIQSLVDKKFIALDEDPNKKKVYFMTSAVGLDQEFLSRIPSKSMRDMQEIIHTVATELLKTPEYEAADKQLLKYGMSHFGRKNDMLGKHHELGVAHHLMRMAGLQSNLEDKYSKSRTEFEALEGNAETSDINNHHAAVDIVDSFIPEGAKITGVAMVTAAARKKNLVDPTDIEVTYQTAEGKAETVRLSMKYQTNQRVITLRTLALSGDGSFGALVGGDEGTSIDNFFAEELDSELNIDPSEHDDSMDFLYGSLGSDERALYKKVAFTNHMAETLKTLESSPEGQTRLQNIWKKLHGCDRGVYMVVTSKVSGKSDVKGPNQYCHPEKVKVTMNQRRITVRLEEDPDSYLEFNYRVRKGAKPKDPGKRRPMVGKLQVLRKLRKS